ncbi:oligosaccharide flippase family protein [Balneolaceae bacterium YR4-1]|uniref:Oligosaccharide flippase family protein n=1 Tax=Halalkalibaculum roseum TaxID=2709311 RepID=A0A6M1SSJ0_9BACT|nr:polysaccharide biosynthesis C-terminal domain-containing protein [Halalkalibaculum roseum]NGP78029.1 oligosaccharide flippase family protein [Halalkalibaculum roseum]
MGVILKQSVQNTVISYLGVALGFVSTILLFPNILTADQYGLTRFLLSPAFVFAQFAHLGIKNVVIRYFPYFKHTRDSRSRLFTLTVLVAMVGFLIFSLLFFSLENILIDYYQEKSPLFTEYYLYLVPLVFAILFFETLNNYVRALQDSITGSFLNEVVMRVLIIILLIVHFFDFISFELFMVGFVSSYCLQPLYLAVYLYRRDELTFSNPINDNIRRLAKSMSVYGLYSLLGGITVHLVGNIDIIMLGSLSDLANTAVYAIAFYVGSVITVPQRSILKIAIPVLADLIKEKKHEQILNLYRRTSLNQIIAGSLLFIGIWANMHNLLGLLPEAYQGAKWVIITIGAAKLFDMATGINGGIIMNSKYYRFDLYTNILLVILTITTNYLLIPTYGIMGAAIATAFSIFVYNAIKMVFVWIKFSMQPFQWTAPVVLLIAAVCLLLSFEIPYLFNFYFDVILRSLLIAIVFLGSILLFNLSDDLKSLVNETLKRTGDLLHKK